MKIGDNIRFLKFCHVPSWVTVGKPMHNIELEWGMIVSLDEETAMVKTLFPFFRLIPVKRCMIFATADQAEDELRSLLMAAWQKRTKGESQ